MSEIVNVGSWCLMVTVISLCCREKMLVALMESSNLVVVARGFADQIASVCLLGITKLPPIRQQFTFEIRLHAFCVSCCDAKARAIGIATTLRATEMNTKRRTFALFILVLLLQ
jgi:hypothetical protein